VTEAVQVALIVSAAPTLIAITGLIIGLRSLSKVNQGVAKVNEISLNVDGNLKELLAINKSSHAEGKAEGVQQERDR
jgi:hypothetical protein